MGGGCGEAQPQRMALPMVFRTHCQCGSHLCREEGSAAADDFAERIGNTGRVSISGYAAAGLSDTAAAHFLVHLLADLLQQPADYFYSISCGGEGI